MEKGDLLAIYRRDLHAMGRDLKILVQLVADLDRALIIEDGTHYERSPLHQRVIESQKTRRPTIK